MSLYGEYRAALSCGQPNLARVYFECLDDAEKPSAIELWDQHPTQKSWDVSLGDLSASQGMYVFLALDLMARKVRTLASPKPYLQPFRMDWLVLGHYDARSLVSFDVSNLCHASLERVLGDYVGFLETLPRWRSDLDDEPDLGALFDALYDAIQEQHLSELLHTDFWRERFWEPDICLDELVCRVASRFPTTTSAKLAVRLHVARLHCVHRAYEKIGEEQEDWMERNQFELGECSRVHVGLPFFDEVKNACFQKAMNRPDIDPLLELFPDGWITEEDILNWVPVWREESVRNGGLKVRVTWNSGFVCPNPIAFTCSESVILDDEDGRLLEKLDFLESPLSQLVDEVVLKGPLRRVHLERLTHLEPFATDLDLDLSYLRLEGIELVELLSSPFFGRVKSLDLEDLGVDADGLEVLVKVYKGNSLVLNQNPIGDRGAQLLTRISSLQALSVVECDIRSRGAEALAAGPWDTCLRLYICDNPIGLRGVRALLDAWDTGGVDTGIKRDCFRNHGGGDLARRAIVLASCSDEKRWPEYMKRVG